MRYFRFPSRLNLLGRNFKVSWTKFKEKKVLGRLNYDKQTIKVDKRSEWPEIILLHEAFHFFCDYYNLERSEVLTESLAKYTFDLIGQIEKRNKKTLKGGKRKCQKKKSKNKKL